MQSVRPEFSWIISIIFPLRGKQEDENQQEPEWQMPGLRLEDYSFPSCFIPRNCVTTAWLRHMGKQKLTGFCRCIPLSPYISRDMWWERKHLSRRQKERISYLKKCFMILKEISELFMSFEIITRIRALEVQVYLMGHWPLR